MHLKTNIEHSSVQIVVLAICSLLTVVSNVNDAVYFAVGTVVCLLVSQIFFLIFNKYLTNNVKAMLTALISAFLVVLASVILKKTAKIVLPESIYFVVFSTTILSAEFIYFRNKALTKHYLFHILKVSFIFVVVLAAFAAIKEFLAFGTLYGKQLLKYDGIPFFKTIVFDLFLLAIICFVADIIVRAIDKRVETKNMVYQKYIKIIRDEKTFQYDILRREKLLTNDIEVNNINKIDAEKIEQKESENEAIESVKEVIEENNEVSETTVADGDENTGAQTETMDDEESSKKSKKKKGDKK